MRESPETMVESIHVSPEEIRLKKAFKILGLIVVLALVAIAAVVAIAQHKYSSQIAQVIEEPDLSLRVAIDPARAEEGKRLTGMKGCRDCHGQDMGGFTFINDPPIGTFTGPNLTTGKGSVTAGYTDQDWVRSIRFGLNRERRYLKFMPSHEYHALSDEDLTTIIAFLKTMPAVDRETVPSKPGPLAKILHMKGNFPMLFPAQLINRAQKPPEKIAPSESPEYGKYLAAGCVGCHDLDYGGGKIKGVPPDWPKAANLTAGGEFAKWSFEDFQKVMKTGVRPDGRKIEPMFMPWPGFAEMTETEMKAIYAFLKTLPGVPSR